MAAYTTEDFVRSIAAKMANEGRTYKEAREIFTYWFITAHLRIAGGNVAKAAKTLGVNRVTPQRHLNRAKQRERKQRQVPE